MRRLLFLFLFLATGFATQAWADAPEIIYSQPGGTLRIYNRMGKMVTESETGAISTSDQEGTMSIVFASDGVVYLQDPVSGYTMSGAWVKGQLSTDGTLITVPLGQYIDYTRSFDMAYQLQMLNYDSTEKTYVVDETTTEVTYTLTSDTTIVLNGTSDQHILGLIFRTFGNPLGAAIGQDFMYLNYLWIGEGDYGSAYTRMDIQAQQPPSNMQTLLYYATSAEYDGAAYYPYSGTVHIGHDGTDMWVQGISRLLPSAWIKGKMQEDGKIVFPTGQFMGTIEGIALFFHGATLDAEGSFNIKDVEMVIDGDGYITYDFVFVTTSEKSLQYVNFYMGDTFLPEQEVPLDVADVETETYTLSYQEYNSNNQLVSGSRKVQLSLTDGEAYIQGIWAGLPEAWVKGRIEGETATFDMPQYLGTYVDDDTTYPIYFTAFDGQTGQMLRQLTFAYDDATGRLSEASSPISIGINKTGYLSVQDYYSPVLTREKTDGFERMRNGENEKMRTYYRLDGRPASQQPQRGMYIRDGKKVLIQ